MADYGAINHSGSQFDNEIAPKSAPEQAWHEVSSNRNVGTLKVWLAVLACLVCYAVSQNGMNAIATQYFTKRIAHDDYHFDYDNNNRSTCGNDTDEKEVLINEVQKDVAALQLKFTITTGIPSLFICLLIGSYSDFMGRKPLLLASTCGSFAKVLILCFIIAFNLNLKFFYIGAALDGLVGSHFTFVIASTSIVADITTVQAKRALRLIVVEGLQVLSVAISQVLIGFLIKKVGYLAPSIGMAAFFVIVLFLVALLCPETSSRNPNLDKNPLVHFKRVIGFYLHRGQSNAKLLYILGIVMFLLGTASNEGRNNVEILFETTFPLCWDSLQVGLFSATRMLVMVAAVAFFLKLMKNRISLETTGLICVITNAASFVLEGFSRTTLSMYMSVLIGPLFLAMIPIPQALLSKITSAEEQGALFSSLSTVQVFFSMAASALFTSIYNSTVDSFKGAVFLVAATLCVMNGVFFALFRYCYQSMSTESDSTPETPQPVIAPASSSKISITSYSSPVLHS